MGGQKKYYFEGQERGYFYIEDKFICRNCLTVDDFNDLFSSVNTTESCSYCEKGKTTIQVAHIQDRIYAAISPYFYSFDSIGMSIDDAESYLVGAVCSFEEVLYELPSFTNSEDFLSDLIKQNAIDQFFRNDAMYLSQSDVFTGSYNYFKSTILHSDRYFFEEKSNEYEPQFLSIKSLLQKIYGLLIASNKIIDLPIDSNIFRGRISKNKLYNFAELGPPPLNRAIYSNRFSPAGISTFYGSLEKATCTQELKPKFSILKWISIGKFITQKNIRLFDFSTEVSIPAFFSEETNERETLQFFNHIVEDFSKPISKDHKEHLDYLHTQVVAEFLKQVSQIKNNDVCGILYRSAYNPDRKNIAFFNSIDCKEILVLDHVEHFRPNSYLQKKEQ
jgi:hypothetical protein